MKRNTVKKHSEKSLELSNFVAILALTAEMARCLNENIAKVHLQPLREILANSGAGEATSRGVEVAKS